MRRKIVLLIILLIIALTLACDLEVLDREPEPPHWEER